MSDSNAAGAPTPGPLGPEPSPPVVPPGGYDRRGRGGGIALGIVLVLIGALVLVGQFTSLADVWRLWPLVVVAIGVASLFGSRHEPVANRIVRALGTIAVGLVLLANTFGALSWAVWLNVLSLWPVLLVAIGIDLVGHGLRLTWMRVASALLLLFAFVYAVFAVPPGSVVPAFRLPVLTAPAARFGDTVARESGVTVGGLAVKVGATRLSVGPGAELIAISGSAPEGAAPTLGTETKGAAASATVEDPSGAARAFSSGARTLDVALDRALEWRSLVFDVGAVEARVDLRQLDARSVTLDCGASAIDVTLGERSRSVEFDVSGGATSVTLHVPASAAVTVYASSGLSAITVPSSYRLVSGTSFVGDSRWAAAGSGGPTITVRVRSGLSALTIESY